MGVCVSGCLRESQNLERLGGCFFLFVTFPTSVHFDYTASSALLANSVLTPEGRGGRGGGGEFCFPWPGGHSFGSKSNRNETFPLG